MLEAFPKYVNEEIVTKIHIQFIFYLKQANQSHFVRCAIVY